MTTTTTMTWDEALSATTSRPDTKQRVERVVRAFDTADGFEARVHPYTGSLSVELYEPRTIGGRTTLYRKAVIQLTPGFPADLYDGHFRRHPVTVAELEGLGATALRAIAPPVPPNPVVTFTTNLVAARDIVKALDEAIAPHVAELDPSEGVAMLTALRASFRNLVTEAEALASRMAR